MPRKRRVSKRREDLSEDAERWLRGEPCGFFKFKAKKELAALWAEHGDRIVAEYIALYPGQRPDRWWQYDAPRIAVGTYPGCFWDGKLAEPRKRLGGVGTPSHEAYNIVPSYPFGIPSSWVDIDPENPPMYESQAAYLERLGMLLAGERLTKQDFESEEIVHE